ncbi:F-box domain, Leucine-rich repeat domain, L domain-like protein [Artemisia annua]|uniref:F-box domain, Leucine-rich repeat domain, L domain-like protein n=1 Tax=Artemisia annua TaxID=35608 RepID=A0A2U1Q4P8_ARTAN|nr:F-box domain, Leucine-rich repeat domain, L domain-like protein [Artemisia annua]
MQLTGYQSFLNVLLKTYYYVLRLHKPKELVRVSILPPAKREECPQIQIKLYTVVANKKELDIIDQCVKLILTRGLKVLDICIMKSRKSRCQPMYLLPDVLSSVSTLTFLKISDCVMLPLSLMVDVLNFKSLKKLRLKEVPLNPLVIKHLSAICPLLQELVVEWCYGFKKFCVNGRLQNLKKLRFSDNNEVESIDIEAPNLCECFLTVGEWGGATSATLGSCKQLRTLYLHGPFFSTSIGFSDFLSNFPFLENLSLYLVNRRDSLTVSSPSLRDFWLYDDCDLEEIDFNTPNLLIFKYANAWDYFTLKSDSGELKTCMECHIIDEVDTLWLLKLRQFLEKANRFKILRLINLHGRFSVDFELLKGTQLPPYELEHVELKMPIRDMLPVLDGLLWCFRPRSLSLTSIFSEMNDEEQSHFLKFISEKLIRQEDQGPTNIRIEWFFLPKPDRSLAGAHCLHHYPQSPLKRMKVVIRIRIRSGARNIRGGVLNKFRGLWAKKEEF